MKTNTRDSIVSTIIAVIMVALSIIAFMGDAKAYDGEFELPIEGTTGYGVIDLTFRANDSSKSAKLGVIPAGEAFTILAEGENYFQVSYKGTIGWAHKTYTMVNLPDLLPSIIYDATNSYNSLYKSGGYSMDGLTGEKLYEGKTWNAKLGKDEYNMPVLFNMAKKLAVAQSAMKADGRSIVLYEGFRPHAVQKLVNTKLDALIKTNSTVNTLINKSGWSKSWFIATSVSNHQKGFAVDVSMAQVSEFEDVTIGDVTVSMPKEYSVIEMPTAMHELSPKAASLAYGVDSKSKTAWQSVPNAKSMNEAALALRAYFVNAGMSPLASEWWHFNDLDARAATSAQGSGNFYIMGNVSQSWLA